MLPIVAAALGACSAATRAPAALPAEARVAAAAAVPAASAGDSVRRGYAAADVRFMQHMIAHHGQALAMTDLVAARAARQEVRLVAQRIHLSQKDEIALMQRWLRERGEAVPAMGPHGAGHDMAGMGAHAGGGHGDAGNDHRKPAQQSLMPGMLTREELERLAAASGGDFDRLFLQYMIRHHEGAIAMVAQLLASQGAAQEPEVFRLASDVDADQRAEIARMRALLGAL